MTKYPKNPAMMKRRQERMAPLGIMSRIPAMLVFESKINLKAYYGSYFRAGLVLVWESLYLGTISIWFHLAYRFCDRVGWTHLREFEPGSEHKTRHGRQCSYLNCDDMHCVDKGIPSWFRKLSGMTRMDT